MRGIDIVKGMMAVLLAAGLVDSARADIRLGLNGGLSWPLDEGTDELELGFRVGVYGMYTLVPNLSAGLVVGYNRWGVDENELIDEIESLFRGDVDGAVHVVELIPAARLTIPGLFSRFDLFGQLGLGVYIRTEQVEFEGTGPLGELITGKPLDDTDGRLGLQVGPGVAFEFLRYFGLEVSGLYNLLFEEGPRSQYITLQAGLGVRIPRMAPEEGEE
jgi:hypothetical protein